MANLNCNHRFGPVSTSREGGVTRKLKSCRYCGLNMVYLACWSGEGMSVKPVFIQYLIDDKGNRYPMETWKGYKMAYKPNHREKDPGPKDPENQPKDPEMQKDAI